MFPEMMPSQPARRKWDGMIVLLKIQFAPKQACRCRSMQIRDA
jgi:hypothetical protein